MVEILVYAHPGDSERIGHLGHRSLDKENALGIQLLDNLLLLQGAQPRCGSSPLLKDFLNSVLKEITCIGLKGFLQVMRIRRDLTYLLEHIRGGLKGSEVQVDTKASNDSSSCVMNEHGTRFEGSAVARFCPIGCAEAARRKIGFERFETQIRNGIPHLSPSDVTVNNLDDRMLKIAEIMKDDLAVGPEDLRNGIHNGFEELNDGMNLPFQSPLVLSKMEGK